MLLHEGLKESIHQNPPTFKISNKCCTYAKKKVAEKYVKDNNFDLSIIGVRKAEGGIRAAKYNSCYIDNQANDDKDTSFYRPLFWYKNEDEEVYDRMFDVKHSDCYEVYGLKRTGCVGCPYNRNISDEIEVMEEFEPQLAKAAKNIFRDSYEYTKQYREFQTKLKQNKC